MLSAATSADADILWRPQSTPPHVAALGPPSVCADQDTGEEAGGCGQGGGPVEMQTGAVVRRPKSPKGRRSRQHTCATTRACGQAAP
jgi:hypothetical protein